MDLRDLFRPFVGDADEFKPQGTTGRFQGENFAAHPAGWGIEFAKCFANKTFDAGNAPNMPFNNTNVRHTKHEPGRSGHTD